MADTDSDTDCNTGSDISVNGDLLLEYWQVIQGE